jgi:hypothetical protein
MAVLDNTQAVFVQIEKVRKALRPLFERCDTTISLLKQKGSVEKVSSRAMRIPIEIAPPGNARKVDFDSSTTGLGLGSGTQYQVATVTPLDWAVALQATKKAEISTNTAEKAIADVVRKDMKNGIKEMNWFLDALLQTPGTGQLSVATTISGTTWTLGGNFKTLLLHRGMRVQLYDSTFATQRAGVAIVQTVNYTAGTITVDTLPTGGVSGDLVVHEGLSGANPVSLNGIPVFQSDSTSGTTLGLTRSSFPEIQAQRINAGSTFLSPSMVRAALNKLRIKRDDDSIMAGLVAHTSPLQTDAYEQNALLISRIDKTSSSKEGFELFFTPSNMAGVPIKTNIKADPTRVDFLCLDRWGLAVSQDIDFYRDPGNGETVFPLYDLTTGARVPAAIWYIIFSGQVFSDDPGAGAYIDTLLKPSLMP